MRYPEGHVGQAAREQVVENCESSCVSIGGKSVGATCMAAPVFGSGAPE